MTRTVVDQSGSTVACPTAPAATVAEPSQVPVAKQSSCPSSTGAKAGIGAGIGVPLAACAAGAILWAIRERRLRKRAERGPVSDMQDLGGMAVPR